MREHALPQDVTGYKFHIIGNMTLKQFAEVAAGCVVGFLLYQTNLYPIIKWPLIVISAGLGAMIAFVPFEERPLDQWVSAFFRALYRPTQYYWKRMSKVPEPFLYQSRTELRSVVGEVDLSPARRQRVKEYLRSIDEVPKQSDELEQLTTQRLGEVMNVFDSQFKPALAAAAEDTQAILNASPDTIGNAVDNLSFVGRATGEETAVETQPELTTQDTQEAEMSNTVLELFQNEEAAPLPAPAPPAPPIPDVVPEPAPPPPPPVPSQPKVEAPVDVLDVVKESKPVVTVKPVPAQSSFTPPPPPKEEPKPQPLPSDVMDIPEVSLESKQEDETEPEPAVEIPTTLPIITNVFDTPAPPPKETPKIMNTGSLSAAIPATSITTDGAANIADVISANKPMSAAELRQKGKTKVQFKTNRTAASDKYETVLPHILDMSGDVKSISIEPTPPPEEPKVTAQTKNVEVPEIQDIKVERTVAAPEDANTASTEGPMSSAFDPTLLQLPEQQTTITSSGVVTLNPDLPFPDKPKTPNKVVGMVINKDGVALPNAIVEILNPAGIPARAVKTNPLGQFFITTPLSPGEYMITAEKEGMKFPTKQLSVTNTIIEPIEIRSS